MKIDAIFQVRCASTRLPNKIFKKILGKPLLWHVVNRVRASKKIDRIILATTKNKGDDKIISFAKKEKLLYFRGSDEDVLDRFYQAAKEHKVKIIARITPDNPFQEPEIVDQLAGEFLSAKGNLDYLSNTIKHTYPEGLNVEIFTFSALEKSWQNAKKPSEREHVTPYIWKNPKKFKIKNIEFSKNLSRLRFTVDYQKDLDFSRIVYQHLYFKKKIFLLKDILKLIKRNPDILKINQGIAVYHEGYLKSLKKDKRGEK